MSSSKVSKVRKFETGATRDNDDGKHDYEAFFSPIVFEERGKYMQRHRIQPDGVLREGDNWQQGIPFSAYMKSLWRHFFDVWKIHRGYQARTDMKDALCAVIFNAEGYLHELLKKELEDGKRERGAEG